MPYEDKTLQCAECSSEFTFTAGEQEFFAERDFTEPKRCKACRKAMRQRKKERRGGAKNRIYRSPAFERSAPDHQKVRGRGGPRPNRPRGAGRAVEDARNRFDGDYRSPAFRDIDVIKPEEEYRAPGFREQESINAEEEYRSPGFQEHANIDGRGEYRAPGYQDQREKYVDQKPEFAIQCSVCGKEATVPFLPEERENPMCRECYAESRKDEVAEGLAEGEAAVEAEPDMASDTEKTEPDAEQ